MYVQLIIIKNDYVKYDVKYFYSSVCLRLCAFVCMRVKQHICRHKRTTCYSLFSTLYLINSETPTEVNKFGSQCFYHLNYLSSSKLRALKIYHRFVNKLDFSWTLWCTPIIPAVWLGRQEKIQFQENLSIQQYPVLKHDK